MIEIIQLDENARAIRMMPNRSATWLDTKFLMLAMVVFVMFIAIAWAFVGAWVILPFAGFEVGLLAFIMYRVSQRTYHNEIITISADNVTIQRGQYPSTSFKEELTLSRNELHVDVTETEQDWHLPQIHFITPSKHYCIGDFLNLSDRKALVYELKGCGIPTCRTHWWKEH
ncbi:DUF2244 domain-containing protein [Alteromonas facilis]|uniref:DUF2244 domain-containing protein n=1 Tax=Alteromonas facilis TaxID=2048004 RepID=UPI000F5D347B|nr:DUF2244 domain-containing protein [Alteromonas facilis]